MCVYVCVCYCEFYIYAAYPAPLRLSTRSVTNNFVVGTLNRCTQNPVGCKSKSGGRKIREELQRGRKKLWRELILYSTYIYVFIWTTPRVWYMVWWEEGRVPIGNSRIHVRTQNKGLCIVTHIFNLENGRLRNNRRSFFISLSRVKTVGFHFRAFSTLRRARFI